ncbi:MAG: hypothetical protein WD469_10590 [Paenibacillaceae bacterium]
MKKLSILMLGIIIGVALAITTSAYASDITSLIGRTIQSEFPVTIEGKELSKKALVIDGTSYVPLRAFGDAIGYDSMFDAELGITFKLNEAKKMQIQKTVEQYKAEAKQEEDDGNKKITDKNAASNKLFQQKIQIDKVINEKKSKIVSTQGVIKTYSDPVMQHDEKIAHPDRDFDAWYKKFTDDLAQMNADLLLLQNQSNDLQKQLDTLNGVTPTPTP